MTAHDLAVGAGLYPARYWHTLEDGRVQCDLCPRDCRLHEGQRGACFVRQRVDDRMVLTTYGRSSGFCVDPVEKKPLNHFYPGSAILSLLRLYPAGMVRNPPRGGGFPIPSACHGIYVWRRNAVR